MSVGTCKLTCLGIIYELVELSGVSRVCKIDLAYGERYSVILLYLNQDIS